MTTTHIPRKPTQSQRRILMAAIEHAATIGRKEAYVVARADVFERMRDAGWVQEGTALVTFEGYRAVGTWPPNLPDTFCGNAKVPNCTPGSRCEHHAALDREEAEPAAAIEPHGETASGYVVELTRVSDGQPMMYHPPRDIAPAGATREVAEQILADAKSWPVVLTGEWTAAVIQVPPSLDLPEHLDMPQEPGWTLTREQAQYFAAEVAAELRGELPPIIARDDGYELPWDDGNLCAHCNAGVDHTPEEHVAAVRDAEAEQSRPCPTCYQGEPTLDTSAWPLRRIVHTYTTEGADPTTAYELNCGHHTIDI